MVALTTATTELVAEYAENRYSILPVDRQHPRRPYAAMEMQGLEQASGH